LSELTARGAGSRAVARGYDQAIAKLGPELAILQAMPVEDIARAGSALLAEAITRLRAGQVIREAGDDGEYGVARVFDENGLARLTAGELLFDAPVSKRRPVEATKPPIPGKASADNGESVAPARPRLRLVSSQTTAGGGLLAQLDADQRCAAEAV